MISLLNLTLFLICVTAYSICSILLKKTSEKELLVLWTLPVMFCFVYLGFTLMLLHQGHTFRQILATLYTYSTTNIIFYLLRSIDLILANIMLFYVLRHFPISQASLVFQVAIPISALYYFVLGEPITLFTLIGIVLVLMGAILASLNKIEYNIIKVFAEIPPKLYIAGTLRVFFQVTGTILIFIVSKRTTETLFIHHALNFRDLGFTQYDTVLHYAMGSIPYILISYFLYFFIIEKISFTELKEFGKKNNKLILINSFLEAFTFILYAIVFQSVKDKLLLTILEKGKIPLILFLAWFFLKEKVGKPQIIATILIISGGIMSII